MCNRWASAGIYVAAAPAQALARFPKAVVPFPTKDFDRMGEWMSAFEIAGDAVKQSRLGRNCCGHEVNKRPLPRSVHLIAAVPFSTLLGDRLRLSERQVTGSNRLLSNGRL